MIRNNDGFSAVELLITLFIASIFLIGANQLAIQVSRDASDTDKTASISNLVYATMRKKRFDSSQDLPCNASSPPAQETQNTTVSGVQGNVSLVTTYSCPFDQVGVYKVTVTATYNDGTGIRTLRHATFTN